MTHLRSVIETQADGESTILLVEDSPLQVVLVREALRRNGTSCAIRVAVSGEEALRALGDMFPDLVLLDLGLPGIAGFDVLRTIRSKAALACMPVVVFSGTQRVDDVRLCYHLGANAFVRKPPGYTEMQGVMRRITDFWLTTAVWPASPLQV